MSDNEYTPTTDEVRKSAAFGATLAAIIPDEAMDIDFPQPGFRVAAKASFDLWLTAHDAEVKAAAWDEGWNTGWDGRMLHDAGIEGHAEATNPYRKAAPNE